MKVSEIIIIGVMGTKKACIAETDKRGCSVNKAATQPEKASSRNDTSFGNFIPFIIANTMITLFYRITLLIRLKNDICFLFFLKIIGRVNLKLSPPHLMKNSRNLAGADLGSISVSYFYDRCVQAWIIRGKLSSDIP